MVSERCPIYILPTCGFLYIGLEVNLNLSTTTNITLPRGISSQIDCAKERHSSDIQKILGSAESFPPVPDLHRTPHRFVGFPWLSWCLLCCFGPWSSKSCCQNYCYWDDVAEKPAWPNHLHQTVPSTNMQGNVLWRNPTKVSRKQPYSSNVFQPSCCEHVQELILTKYIASSTFFVSRSSQCHPSETPNLQNLHLQRIGQPPWLNGWRDHTATLPRKWPSFKAGKFQTDLEEVSEDCYKIYSA